jgi:hypothetical protein
MAQPGPDLPMPIGAWTVPPSVPGTHTEPGKGSKRHGHELPRPSSPPDPSQAVECNPRGVEHEEEAVEYRVHRGPAGPSSCKPLWSEHARVRCEEPRALAATALVLQRLASGPFGRPASLARFQENRDRESRREGVPQSEATAMVGQKTEEVYRRYAIVDQAMIREAAIEMNRGAKVRRTTAQRTSQSDQPSADR